MTTRPTHWRFRLKTTAGTLQERDLIASEQTELVIGVNAYLQLLEINADSLWPLDDLLHYDIGFDDRLQYQTEAPAIWQITSSGIKNEFPVALVEWLDRLNRWLFAPWSPLNLLTQRSSFRIWPRLPEGRSAVERLWNNSGIGDVILDSDYRPARILQLNTADGGTQFKEGGREG